MSTHVLRSLLSMWPRTALNGKLRTKKKCVNTSTAQIQKYTFFFCLAKINS